VIWPTVRNPTIRKFAFTGRRQIRNRISDGEVNTEGCMSCYQGSQDETAASLDQYSSYNEQNFWLWKPS